MNMKKLLCLAMALLLALGTLALAETDAEVEQPVEAGEAVEAEAEAEPEVEVEAEPEATEAPMDLDAALARIAELEAQVEQYRPYYEAQIVAEYGDGGVIWLADAQKEYEGAASAYAQYGLNIEDYADGIKQQILQNLVQTAVVDDKAAELGLDQMSDEERANLESEAQENYETYIESYKSYFAAEDATDEEAREQTVAAMEQYGLTLETLTQQMLDSYVDEQLHTYVTKDVDVTDEEVQAKYEDMVAADEAAYAEDDNSYNSARNEGATIAWNPEGYRAVKHVLIHFSDEQSQQYSDLKSTLDSLNDELEALTAPAEEEAESDEDAGDEDAEEVEPEGDEADEEPQRTAQEVQSDIGRVATEIEALYSELLPDAQKVIDEFNAGADFQTLIDKYNTDPGMQSGATAENGYAVCADSTTWDPAFTEGAMSIESVGQISAPIYGSNGIHVIYYLSDITPGAVPFEEIADAVKADALSEKVEQTYNDQIAAWVEEAAPVYHLDRF